MAHEPSTYLTATCPIVLAVKAMMKLVRQRNLSVDHGQPTRRYKAPAWLKMLIHRCPVRADAPADLAFHEVLFEAADNAFLEALVQPLASVIRELREETSSAPETREHAIDYHGRILRRVADRDSEGARDEMREHLVLTEEYMERFRVRPRNSPAAS